MKPGRPPLEDREPLSHVGFKADETTLAAIDRLVRAASRPGVLSPKSAAIRRALIEAAGRLPPEEPSASTKLLPRGGEGAGLAQKRPKPPA